MFLRLLPLLFASLLLSACGESASPPPPVTEAPPAAPGNTAPSPPAPAKTAPPATAPQRADVYSSVALTADLSHLSNQQRQMLPLLIRASELMDDLFWQQAWGDRQSLLDSIDDPGLRRFAEINYGPWDRLNGDQPFIPGTGDKPAGARFYPADMSKAEFEAWDMPGKKGQYSLVQRNSEGALTLLPYHQAYAAQLAQTSALLRQAADLAQDPEFASYLRLRAQALLSDEYQASDMAWMDMKNNAIELVIGPIEDYEDQLFGYRASYESYVLLKDKAWSAKLSRFADYLPDLQRGLPVDEEYKREMPGSNADLGAYDVLYYAGHSNAGSKTIAINLPNDEAVQLAKGTRRLQLKNAMRAKFDQILVPIAGLLIAPEQRDHVTFDAFFTNTMFHEVAHGLGIKTTLDGSATVREALKEHSAAIEEGKADILGLYMVQALRDKKEITEGELMDNYVTFMAGIFRSVRFGASSAHGKANMIRFNFFEQAGAFSRDEQSGYYRISVPEFEAAVKALSQRLLVLQGNGDYAAVDSFINASADIRSGLRADLDRLAAANIPVDIVFEQGVSILGLDSSR